jgi:hypothetical protein
MSALGQKQTLTRLFHVSALPPKADISCCLSDVRFVPKADIVTYSITLSARASSVGGISRPRNLAALRLITSSNFVACVTGMSAGFSPLRTRPVVILGLNIQFLNIWIAIIGAVVVAIQWVDDYFKQQHLRAFGK